MPHRIFLFLFLFLIAEHTPACSFGWWLMAGADLF
jgi:hypothetical protein